jgi:hypothetical protein
MMAREVISEKVVGARRREVFAFLADYRKRPLILPLASRDVRIEEDPAGDDAVFAVHVRGLSGNGPLRFRAVHRVDGEALDEVEEGSGMTLSWALRTTDDGNATRVRVTTSWPDGRGGLVRRLLAPRAARRFVSGMLAQLGPAVRRARAEA